MNGIRSIGIIGYGKFGLLLETLLVKVDSSIDLKIYYRKEVKVSKRFSSLNEVINSDLIIPAVPIREFENVIKTISEKVKSDSIVMDVCSVKDYPIKIMKKYLPQSITIIGSHPLFGPQTVHKLKNRSAGLNMVMQFVRGEKNKYENVKSIFKKLNLKIIEIDSDSHDKFVAKSQFPAHVIGNFAHGFGMSSQLTDTKSNEVLNDFLEIIQPDPKFLKDIYRFNPYAKKEFAKIEKSFKSVIKMIKH